MATRPTPTDPAKRVLLVMSSGLMCFRHMQLGVYRFAALHPEWKLSLCSAEEDYGSLVERHRPDGLLLGPVNGHDRARAVVGFAGTTVGVCGNHADYGLPGLPEVNIDNHAIGSTAAAFYIQKGYRHFAYLGSNNPWARERGRGFREALARAGHPVAEFEQVWTSLSIVNDSVGDPRLPEWLAGLPKPLALLACNDVRGRDAVQACREVGLQVPDEVAVLGVDNDDLHCAISDPALSSVAIPWRRMGSRAAELLHQRMTGQPQPPGHRPYPPIDVAERQSTGAVAIDDPEVRRAVQFVRANAHRPISVEDVVAAVGTVARRSLERRFRAILGRSPLAEIRAAHFARAKLLLGGSETPLDEVARASGFTDPEWFAKTFRDTFGESPQDFRAGTGPGEPA